MACQSISTESIFNDELSSSTLSAKEYTCISSSSPASSITELFTAEELITPTYEEKLSITTFSTASAAAAAARTSPSSSLSSIATSPWLSTASTQGEEGPLSTITLNERECRICFCSEDGTGTNNPKSLWMSPCKCDGSMKWVHQTCFNQWITMAPMNQRSMCTFCGFKYQRALHLKSIRSWTFPPFRVFWQFCTDILCTADIFIGVWQLLHGKRYIVWQILLYTYWKKYTLPRIKNRRIVTDILETTILKPEIISLNE